MKAPSRKILFVLGLSVAALSASGCSMLSGLLGGLKLDDGLALSSNQPNIGYAATVKTEDRNGVLLYGMYAYSDGQSLKQ